ncbi:MAG: hypothetical protein ACI33S_05615 [Bacilli bacterium]
MSSSNKAMDFKCPSCSAPITYKIKSKNWTCDYCKNSFTLEEIEKFNKKNSIENIKQEKKSDNSKGDYIRYFCKNCNAEIIADEQTVSTFCIYCGNTAILKEKLSGAFAPSKIIPFKKDRQEAIDAFVSLSKGRRFIAKEFNSEKNIEKITGIYIPFWLYDLSVEGKIEASAEDEMRWMSGDKTYIRTKVFNCIREGSAKFNRIPIDASTRFDNDIMNSIEPFDYGEMEKYNHAYLSGYLAEKCDDDPKKAEENVKMRAVNTLRNIMKNNIRHQVVTIKEDTLKSGDISNEYVLLPVWMVNVKYGNKIYPFAMNGQTGKFIGNIPINKKKVFLVSLLMFIGIFIVVILVSHLIYLGGN